MDELRPTSLTWAALLAGWLDFARTSVALPDDAEGGAWRESIAAIIRLQAATFALGEIDQLSRDEQALAIDKAEMLIRESSSDLDAAWSGDAAPASVREVRSDALLALNAARAVVRAGRDDQNNAS